jgi:hypothetical protein
MTETTFQIYLGIDVTMGAKPVTFVALDVDQALFAIGEGDSADALAFAAGQSGRALVAVNAAACPNKGRMRREAVRSTLDPQPGRGKHTALRQAEYELLAAGASVAATPSSAEKSLPWVRRGFALVRTLGALGYRALADRAGEANPREWLETNADAAFWSLLGVTPLPAGTLEGRIQRQLVLRDEELRVPDAMDFFEEVTRYRLLKSVLPTENIFSQAEINAWMAAHTAWLVDHHQARLRLFGEPEEGVIYLPGPQS